MIQAEHLTKDYGSRRVVNDVSFHLGEKEILGFLGKNGAGKSTTMNMLTGYISATSGTVHICGIDIARKPEQAKMNIGYLPEIPPLYPEMTVEEYLRYACAVKGVRRSAVKPHIEYICQKTGLTEMRRRLIGHLSKGYRQRVGLANALIGDPPVIILDEPSVGLDPQQMIEMRQCIRSLGKEHSGLLSSHILSEISLICDRVMVIDQGKLVAESSLEDLLKQDQSWLLRLSGEKAPVLSAIRQLDGIEEAHETPEGLLFLRIRPEQEEETLKRLFYTLADLRCPILELRRGTNRMEDIFLKLTEQGVE